MERVEVPRIQYNPALAEAFLRRYPDLQVVEREGVKLVFNVKGLNAADIETFRLNIRFLSLNPTIPLENLFCDLDNYQPRNTSQEELLKWANNLVDFPDLSKPSGLFIWGSAGVGKTHIAVAVAKKFLMRGFEPVYIQGPAYGFNSRVLDTREPRIIIIDDFNSGYGSVGEAMRTAVLHTHNYGGKLMVTSNADFAVVMLQMQGVMGKAEMIRYMDRMKSMFQILHIEGGSYRQDTAWHQQVPS